MAWRVPAVVLCHFDRSGEISYNLKAPHNQDFSKLLGMTNARSRQSPSSCGLGFESAATVDAPVVRSIAGERVQTVLCHLDASDVESDRCPKTSLAIEQ